MRCDLTWYVGDDDCKTLLRLKVKRGSTKAGRSTSNSRVQSGEAVEWSRYFIGENFLEILVMLWYMITIQHPRKDASGAVSLPSTCEILRSGKLLIIMPRQLLPYYIPPYQTPRCYG